MARAGIPVHTVSGEVMAELAQTVTPQGLLAVCGFVDVPLEQAIAAVAPGAAGERSPRLVTLLACVRDPGNAGTVLRTADAAGAQAVIFSDASVDPYNGKCVRASAGSLFHLPLVAGVPLDTAVSALRGAGLRILAADARGGRTLDELTACRTGRADGLDLRQRGVGHAGRAARAGRRERRGAYLRPGREPEPGHRRRRLPLRLRPRGVRSI